MASRRDDGAATTMAADDRSLGRNTFAEYWLDHKNWAGEERFTPGFARGVVEEFVNTWPRLGMATESLNRGRTKAGEKHVEPLEALLELFQNANDTGASWARLVLRKRDLLFVHDGRRVHMRDVPAIVMPYLTTKEHDTGSLGRFGIGLKTLTVLGPTLEVHSHPYHFAAGIDGPEVADPRPAVRDVYDPKAKQTLFRLPLEPGVLDPDDLLEWVAGLGVQGLVFLRSLRRLTVVAGGRSVELKVKLKKDTDHPDGVLGRVTERHLSGGGGWRVYSTEVTPPPELVPTDKDRDVSVTVSVALSNTADGGRICVGLPVERRVAMPMSINAPFDPDEARRDLRHTEWNHWLFERLAELATAVVRVRFEQDPRTAWRGVPLAAEIESEHAWLAERLQAMRTSIVNQIKTFTVQPPDPKESPVSLKDVQHEPEWVDDVLPPDLLTIDQPGIVPSPVRDAAGRWRHVLRDAKLGRRLSAADAVGVVNRSEATLADRTPGWWAALVATFLRHQQAEALDGARVLILSDGRRVSPEDVDNGLVLTLTEATAPVPVLASLDDHFLAEPHRDVIQKWLEKGKRLALEPTDDRLLEALATWSGDPHHLNDEAAIWLQHALWELDEVHRDSLAVRIGKNVTVDGYDFVEGKRSAKRVVAGSAYLPSTVTHQGDSFSKAAASTPDLHWVSARYEQVLRPSGERTSDGALPTLRLLGARLAPGLEVRTWAENNRYARVAYWRDDDAGALQDDAIDELDGYGHNLLGDHDASDLVRVAFDIAADTDRKRRRARAAALFKTLAREWPNIYSGHEQAKAVTASRGWNWAGRVPATWASKLAEIPWMSTGKGSMRPPRTLVLDTESLRAAHGAELPYASGLDADAQHVDQVARALGMQFRPAATGLVDELRHLRDTTGEFEADLIKARWEQLILGLALLCPKVDDEPPEVSLEVDDMTVEALRAAFGRARSRAGLVFDGTKWRSGTAAVVGTTELGRFRVALPDREPLDRLWRVLGIQTPQVSDCAAVVEELAAAPLAPEDAGIYVSVLRLMAKLVSREDVGSDLTTTPLWSGSRWVRSRPVYGMVDRGLATKVAQHADVWDPRCNLESLGQLPTALGVTVLTPGDFTLAEVTADHRTQGEIWRSRFTSAVGHLRAQCAEHYPPLYAALEDEWTNLAGAALVVAPDLVANVRIGEEAVTLEAEALAVRSPDAVAVRTDSMFESDELGLALAAAWLPAEVEAQVPQKTLALLWADAWRAAKHQSPAEALELPSSKLDLLRDTMSTIEERQGPPPKPRRPSDAEEADGDENSDNKTFALKDPDSLSVASIAIEVGEGTDADGTGADGHSTGELEGAEELKRGGGRPGSGKARKVSAPDADPEDVAMRILRRALRADTDEMRDFRSRRNIGADAVDADLGFLELKGYQGAMPSSITLTRDEARRAIEEKEDFVLAVVAGLRVGTQTVVRLIPDPMSVLDAKPSSSVSLHGVDTADAVVVKLHDHAV